LSVEITISDNELEILIRHYRDLIGDDRKIIDDKRKQFERMKYFVNSRSNEKILRMEKERGLNV